MRIRKGQVAFITGGASGIGLALARACGAENGGGFIGQDVAALARKILSKS